MHTTTTIHLVKRDGVQPPFVRAIRAACDKLNTPGNAASMAQYGDMRVAYGAWGIMCRFDQRLLRYPREFENLAIAQVSMKVTNSKTGTVGTYNRPRSKGVVEMMGGVFYTIHVDAKTLEAANRLLSDILSGRAKPTRTYKS